MNFQRFSPCSLLKIEIQRSIFPWSHSHFLSLKIKNKSCFSAYFLQKKNIFLGKRTFLLKSFQVGINYMHGIGKFLLSNLFRTIYSSKWKGSGIILEKHFLKKTTFHRMSPTLLEKSEINPKKPLLDELQTTSNPTCCWKFGKSLECWKFRSVGSNPTGMCVWEAPKIWDNGFT